MPGAIPPGLVGVPCVTWMYTRACLALLRLYWRLPEGSDVRFEPGNSTLAGKRNELVQRFLEEPRYRWLLCLDSDMTPPPDIVERLWALGSPLAAAPCAPRFGDDLATGSPINVFRVTRRGEASDPKAPWTADPGLGCAFPTRLPEEPFEVDACGAGCLLVRREVLEAMDPPWFVATPEDVGEDVNFTLRATDAGFRLLVDPAARVGHIGLKAYTVDDTLGSSGGQV